jgi:hypothetical protein
MMKIVGLLLVLFGITDFALSWLGTDVWYEWFGIQLPGFLYFFSAIIAVSIGSAMMRSGRGASDDSADSE